MTAEYLDATNTVQFQPASPQNPDILVVNSKDKNACAATVIVTGLPAVGTNVLLQITSQQRPQPFQYWHVVAQGDTLQSLASNFAGQIAADPNALALGIGGQLIVGSNSFGVSHWFSDLIVVSAAAWNPNGSQIPMDNGGVFTFQQARAALDAGPVLGLNKFPDGWTPTAGSNVGQLNFGGPRTDTVGAVGATYAGVCGNIINPDPGNLQGELEIDVGATVNGVPSIKKVAGFTGDGLRITGGLWVNGAKIA